MHRGRGRSRAVSNAVLAGALNRRTAARRCACMCMIQFAQMTWGHTWLTRARALYRCGCVRVTRSPRHPGYTQNHPPTTHLQCRLLLPKVLQIYGQPRPPLPAPPHTRVAPQQQLQQLHSLPPALLLLQEGHHHSAAVSSNPSSCEACSKQRLQLQLVGGVLLRLVW